MPQYQSTRHAFRSSPKCGCACILLLHRTARSPSNRSAQARLHLSAPTHHHQLFLQFGDARLGCFQFFPQPGCLRIKVADDSILHCACFLQLLHPRLGRFGAPFPVFHILGNGWISDRPFDDTPVAPLLVPLGAGGKGVGAHRLLTPHVLTVESDSSFVAMLKISGRQRWQVVGRGHVFSSGFGAAATPAAHTNTILSTKASLGPKRYAWASAVHMSCVSSFGTSTNRSRCERAASIARYCSVFSLKYARRYSKRAQTSGTFCTSGGE